MTKLVNVSETRDFGLYFVSVNNISNFDAVIDSNSEFVQDTYPIRDSGLNVKRDYEPIDGPEELSSNFISVYSSLSIFSWPSLWSSSFSHFFSF